MEPFSGEGAIASTHKQLRRQSNRMPSRNRTYTPGDEARRAGAVRAKKNRQDCRSGWRSGIPTSVAREVPRILEALVLPALNFCSSSRHLAEVWIKNERANSI